MTITSEVLRADHVPNGSTTNFPTGFYFLEDEHLAVYLLVAGVESLLVLNTDYTVTGAGSQSGGEVVISPAPTGDKLSILRDVPFTQLTDYVEDDSFPADSHERALDKLTMAVQELKENGERSLQAPVTDTSGFDWTLPVPAPGFGWQVNAAGTGVEETDEAFADFVPLAQAASVSAQNSASAAAISETLANEWAENPEDSPVEPGEYSAFHWAKKAEAEVSFPAGTRLLLAQASAPLGWTQDTDSALDNRMLRVVNSAGGGTGGSHSPILNDVVPTHGHTASSNTTGNHTHSITLGNGQGTPSSRPVYSYPNAYGTAYTNTAGNHAHTITVVDNSGTDWTPRYIDMIIAVKDA
ncbi:MAG: hypothetical protein DRP45_00970 [Candidatus Zixiibacteriota bacterium]|nr:MAG: hypothetical protein DRP45_00970 [candidate division Zixibacteria bacterium]